MNISFYDGINDGKFFNISAGKYDDLDDIDDINVDDIDISEEIENEEEDDTDTCLNRFAALEKDASKLHMDLNNLRNEFKGSCKDWNNLSDTVDHMLNSIAELRTMMDKVNDRVNNRFKVVSEATAELADKLSLVEKKLEVFKCIDILDRVTKLEEQVKPTVLEEAKELEVRPSVLDNILDRITKLEERYDTNNKLIGDLGRRVVDTDCNLSRLSDRVSKLDSKLAVTDKIVEAVKDKACTIDTINGTISGYDYAIISDRINELESKIKKLEDTKCDKSSPSVADDIFDRLGKLEGKYTTCHNSNKLAIGRLYERLGKVEPKLEKLDMDVTSIDKVNDRMGIIEKKLAMFYDILDRVTKLEEQIRNPLDYNKIGPKTESVIEDLVKYMGMTRKYAERPFESDNNDIQDDPVNHPKHYTDGKYECIDFIEEYGMVTHIGNAIKYISRTGKKDTSKYAEDLNKAFWYLHRYNTPQSMGHINVIDYCNEKKLPMELTAVIIAISCEDYKGAEQILRDYITKITDKTSKAFEDEQSK